MRPQSLSASQRPRAARAFAELHAPFEETGILILRAPAGAEIWYWDKSKLGAQAENMRVSPESVWQEAGDGWRVLACAEGFEAQYWSGEQLMASTWRRGPFTESQWAAFALSVDEPDAPPPTTPPAAISSSLVDTAWRRRVIGQPLGWRDVERAGVSVAICGAALAAFFSAQALRSDITARGEHARLESIQESFRQDSGLARALEQRRLLREYAAAVEQPPVLRGAAEAHAALAAFDLRARSWRADAEGLNVIVDAPIAESPVREVVVAIEEAPRLCGAVPEIASSGGFEIRARITAPEASCSAAEAERRP